MAQDLDCAPRRLRVDGGAAANDLLMQMQSDISDVTVERPSELESTARGAAMLAGLGAGIFHDAADAAQMIRIDRTFVAGLGDQERESKVSAWRDAVRRARGPTPGT
jgi:glycerol kinase